METVAEVRSLTEEEISALNYPGAPSIKVQPPGPKTAKIRSVQEKYETQTVKYMKYFPTAWESDKGGTLRDVDGNLYITLAEL